MPPRRSRKRGSARPRLPARSRRGGHRPVPTRMRGGRAGKSGASAPGRGHAARAAPGFACPRRRRVGPFLRVACFKGAGAAEGVVVTRVHGTRACVGEHVHAHASTDTQHAHAHVCARTEPRARAHGRHRVVGGAPGPPAARSRRVRGRGGGGAGRKLPAASSLWEGAQPRPRPRWEGLGQRGPRKDGKPPPGAPLRSGLRLPADPAQRPKRGLSHQPRSVPAPAAQQPPQVPPPAAPTPGPPPRGHSRRTEAEE